MYGGLSLSEGILGNVYRYITAFLLIRPSRSRWCFCMDAHVSQSDLLFRYSVSERRWTQMLTSALEDGSAPPSRYHHASSLLAHESGSHGASHSFMLVVGGVTPDGVAGDTWSLNLSSLIWREHPVSLHMLPKASVCSGFSTMHSDFAPLRQSSVLPPVAGHTLTVRRDSSVLLIGGYSPENGFNHHLLEFNPQSGNWTIAPHTGTPPTGLGGLFLKAQLLSASSASVVTETLCENAFNFLWTLFCRLIWPLSCVP